MFSNPFTKPETKEVRASKIGEFKDTVGAWNFEQMKDYTLGRMKTPELNDFGLAAILVAFINKMTHDKSAPGGKRRLLESFDLDARTKKGMDLLLSIISHKKISSKTLDLVPDLLEKYKDVFTEFDTKNHQTYVHKFKETYKFAQVAALAKAQMKREMQVTDF